MAETTDTSKGTSEFTCPECGRTFARAAALGAHRRSHGVAGKKSKSATARGNGRTRGRRRSATRGSSAAAGTASRRAGSRQRGGGIDRDALLRAVFPNGMPAREEALSAISGWLDEAERLAQLR